MDGTRPLSARSHSIGISHLSMTVTPIMSCSNLLLAVLLLVSTASAAMAGGIRCPNDKLLLSEDLFDGPPSEMVNLVPIPGGWFNLRNSFSKDAYYLQCNYKGTTHTEIIRLPPTVTNCLFDKHGPNVTCR